MNEKTIIIMALLFPELHVQGILRVQTLSRLGFTSNGDASATMRLRTVLCKPLSSRRDEKTRSNRQVF